MSDIRLILIGSLIIFAGFYIAGMAGSQYNQISIQKNQFDDCYDYSSGTAIHVNCVQQEQDALLHLGLALCIIGGGVYLIFKGIKGRWDQNVKSDEMVGPKHD
ncbi:hypothetical protein DYY67_0780 [Candidatus Nitrosotalea sp. TS]|uniref:hypothetical protein n=1 Tax=Candidatus Nitrosotalea sp. TS TaxID=2341020 RepID=UPI001408DD09|nr:hypothetical protein [Candidatus Nitrosotalea sp. TS]NHI03710.1 hypothetical protein [Candidatus Nitrosotalea sp. TS]